MRRVMAAVRLVMLHVLPDVHEHVRHSAVLEQHDGDGEEEAGEDGAHA
jgi:hypothetical protein